MKSTILLTLIYFYVIGFTVHKIMGKDGGLLHNVFVGGCGFGTAALLEYISGCYTKTFIGAVVLCIACSCAVECCVRWIKRRLHTKDTENDLN